jgi:hypothetical protein
VHTATPAMRLPITYVEWYMLERYAQRMMRTQRMTVQRPMGTPTAMRHTSAQGQPMMASLQVIYMS